MHTRACNSSSSTMSHPSLKLLQSIKCSTVLRDLFPSTIPTARPPAVLSLEEHEYRLPDPFSITTKLIAIGITPSAAEKLSDIYLRNGLHLKEKTEVDIRSRICLFRRHASGQDHSNPESQYFQIISHKYVQTLESWEVQIVERARERVAVMPKRCPVEPSSSVTNVSGRSNFNQAALPLLENFFNNNAFPSRAEKMSLAERSGMEYKQIYIWFQNRRTRKRKEGVELKRGTSNTSSNISISKEVTSLPSDRSDRTYTYHEDVLNNPKEISLPSDRPDRSCAQNEGVLNNLEHQRPNYAFPASYPSFCSYDAFAIEPDSRTFVTPWMRRAATSPFKHSASIDLTHFVDMFSRLSLSEAERYPTLSARPKGPHASPHELPRYPRQPSRDINAVISSIMSVSSSILSIPRLQPTYYSPSSPLDHLIDIEAHTPEASPRVASTNSQPSKVSLPRCAPKPRLDSTAPTYPPQSTSKSSCTSSRSTSISSTTSSGSASSNGPETPPSSPRLATKSVPYGFPLPPDTEYLPSFVGKCPRVGPTLPLGVSVSDVGEAGSSFFHHLISPLRQSFV